MNHITLIGRLTKDPEQRSTQTGKTVTSFSLAVNRFGGEHADFFRCQAWEKTGQIVYLYCHKGDKLAVEGRIQFGKYTDRNGNERDTADVIVSNVELLESKKKEEAPAPKADNGFIEVPDIGEDELPFH